MSSSAGKLQVVGSFIPMASIGFLKQEAQSVKVKNICKGHIREETRVDQKNKTELPGRVENDPEFVVMHICSPM